MKQQENRRVRMTKRLLKDALLELMETHDLISISVTAICKTADVHRHRNRRHAPQMGQGGLPHEQKGNRKDDVFPFPEHIAVVTGGSAVATGGSAVAGLLLNR